MTNALYFGDNLHVLREYVKDETADLIYLDPPFNSNASYNVLFRAPSGARPKAQVDAFRDTWHWGEEAEQAFEDVKNSRTSAAGIVRALRSFLGENDLMAYLAMMAVRLIEMHRVLKKTGCLFLHCDPTADHYLRILLDAIFSPEQFTNEIIWRRTTPKGLAFTRFASNHDVILYYRRSDQHVWNPQYVDYSPEYVQRYNLIDEKTGRRFQATSLLNPNPNRPNPTYEFHGHTKVWRWTRERMLRAAAEGRIYFPPNGGVPREKRFLDEQEGVPVSSVWTDIPAVNAVAQEWLGYPTQKPLALLERIIGSASSPGDIVLDPFCGCGTAVHAASKLDRQWIGIDITHVAIQIIEDRLRRFCQGAQYDVIGRPRDLEGAEKLAELNKYQFQWWATSLVKAQPRGGYNKKGPDRGIDGEIFFKLGAHEDGRAIVSVKGGINLNPSMVRDLIGTRKSEDAEMALLITLAKPTQEMVTAAAKDGFIGEGDGRVPRTQILTIEQLLTGLTFRTPAAPLYDTATAAAEAAQSSRRPRQRRTPEELHKEPPLPPMSLSGGRARQRDRQEHLPIDEPLLLPQRAVSRRRS
ncbi:MAG: site-specific DNA-methyltransferase [Alphaproteobacteria bacterium]